ncbi:hypothetical protein HY522_12285, partial [bacterium]|nr:hypothetical protein [bacterium]
ERAGRRVREFQKRVATEVRNKYGPPSKLFLFQGREVYYLDRPYLAANDTSYTSILADIRFWASSETWISRIYDRDQLMSGERLNAVGEQLRHSFHPSIGADLYFIPRPYVYTSGYPNGTGHGTPYSYDNHVPLLWYDPARPPVEISDTVYTVDIAPTLAERIGLRPPEMLDGQVLPANP